MSELFVNAFIKGIGRTTGVVFTMLVSWKLMKLIYRDNILGLTPVKIDKKTQDIGLSREAQNNHLASHDKSENDLQYDLLNENSFKKLFDKKL